jgi:archaellum component FlaC
MEELLWKSRILEQKAQEHTEWQMMTAQQLDSQIERVRATLGRQKLGNAEMKRHLQSLDDEIATLRSLAGDQR